MYIYVRFYREAQAAAKLQHRKICPVYDVGEIDGKRYISMAYIAGYPLSNYINSQKLPSIAAAVSIATDGPCAGLAPR